MELEQTIKRLKKYFSIKELVSKAVYEKLGENAWLLFDPRLLETLLALREFVLNVPLVCNNWASGGTMQQRGFRENVSQIVKDKTDKGTLYLSGHVTGQALDLSSPKMSADKMRETIKKNKAALPYGLRVENGKDAPTWLHIDVKCLDGLTIF